MKPAKAAILTSALFFPKGTASALHFMPGFQRTSDPVTGGAEPPNGNAAAKPVRMSIGLDRARHLRLKLTALRLGTTSREILVAALDHYANTVVAARLGGACPCAADAVSARDYAVAPPRRGDSEPRQWEAPA